MYYTILKSTINSVIETIYKNLKFIFIVIIIYYPT